MYKVNDVLFCKYMEVYHLTKRIQIKVLSEVIHRFSVLYPQEIIGFSTSYPQL